MVVHWECSVFANAKGWSGSARQPSKAPQGPDAPDRRLIGVNADGDPIHLELVFPAELVKPLRGDELGKAIAPTPALKRQCQIKWFYRANSRLKVVELWPRVALHQDGAGLPSRFGRHAITFVNKGATLFDTSMQDIRFPASPLPHFPAPLLPRSLSAECASQTRRSPSSVSNGSTAVISGSRAAMRRA